MSRLTLLAVLVVALGCRRERVADPLPLPPTPLEQSPAAPVLEGSPMAPEEQALEAFYLAVQPVPPSSAPPDPSVRFFAPAPLVRPAPWLAEAPHLDALLPEGEALSLREQWLITSTELPASQDWVGHRVQAIYVDAGVHDLRTIQRLLSAMEGRDRRDAPPPVTLLDPELPAGTVRIDRGAAAQSPVAAWRDDQALGRPVHVDARAFAGAGLQITITVFHPLEARGALLSSFVDGLGDEDGLFAAIRRTGAVRDVSFHRSSTGASRTMVVERVPAPAEVRAREAAYANVPWDDPEATLERIAAIEDPPHHRWLARLRRVMRARRFSLDPEAREPDVEPAWRTDETEVFVVGESVHVIRGAQPL